MSLSGGQRQRLALARVVAAGPRRARARRSALSASMSTRRRLSKRRSSRVLATTTALIVAHRPSTVCDGRSRCSDAARPRHGGRHAQRAAPHERPLPLPHFLASLDAPGGRRQRVADETHPNPGSRLNRHPGGGTMSPDNCPRHSRRRTQQLHARGEPASADARCGCSVRCCSPLRAADHPHRGPRDRRLGTVQRGRADTHRVRHRPRRSRARSRTTTGGRRSGTSLAYLAIGGGGAALVGWYVVLIAKLTQAVMIELRTRIFRHTQRLSLEFHEAYTSGRIISRQTSDLEIDPGAALRAASRSSSTPCCSERSRSSRYSSSTGAAACCSSAWASR